MCSKKLFMFIIVIIILSTITSCSSPVSNNLDDIPYPHISRVSLTEAYEMFLEDSAVFLDVRASEQYSQERIPDSVNIPLDLLSSSIETLDPEERYITICT